MRRHRAENGDVSRERHPDERGGGTLLMALALFAGVIAGAKLAESLYREEQERRRREERRDRIERWEDEGGALHDTIGTGGAANPRPSM